MNKYQLVVLIIIIAILGVGAANVVYDAWYVLDEYETEVFFRVSEGNAIGFAADTDKLHFGKMSKGGGGERQVILKSDVDAYVYFTYNHVPAEWFWMKENPVGVRAGEVVRIQLGVEIPLEATAGNYTGSLTTTYVRRLPWDA